MTCVKMCLKLAYYTCNCLNLGCVTVMNSTNCMPKFWHIAKDFIIFWEMSTSAKDFTQTYWNSAKNNWTNKKMCNFPAKLAHTNGMSTLYSFPSKLHMAIIALHWCFCFVNIINLFHSLLAWEWTCIAMHVISEHKFLLYLQICWLTL